MTTITGGANPNTNSFDSSELLSLASGTLGAHDSTQFVLTQNPYIITGFGTGFTYSGNHPVSGTLTSLTVGTAGFLAVTTWTNFSLSAATVWNAIATGNATAFNTMFFGGDDTFNMASGGGTDFLIGGGGNDTFNYGSNFHATIDGGPGNDTINLDGNYANSIGADFGTVTNVEMVHVAAGHSYHLQFGNSSPPTVDASALGAANYLMVEGLGTGSLNATGGAGNDTFISGGGDDTFDGGNGSDTVDYRYATGGVSVDLTKVGAQAVGGGRGSDSLISIENIVGSSYNDTLTGDSNDNFLDGGSGDDVLNGGDGNDLLYASDGNDVLNGGNGSDTVSFASAAGPVTVDLRSSSPVNGATLISIEGAIGSWRSGDLFIGNSADNFFDSGGTSFVGYDTVTYQYATGGMTFQMTSLSSVIATGGGQGTDTIVRYMQIIGSPYDDTFYYISQDGMPINGGGGNDTLSFQGAPGPVYVSLDSRYASIKTMIGSSYNDTLYGSNSDDVINGGPGNDKFYGGPDGSSGNGNDTFIGGAGVDTVYFPFSGSVLNHTITYNPDHSITVSGGSDGTDTLWGIEKLVFDNAIIWVTHLTGTDFDGDGASDILWQNDNGQPAISLMNGSAQLYVGPVGSNPGTSWHAIGSGEFNGDGVADVLWQNVDGSIAAWFMSGTTVAGGGLVSFNPGPSWKAVTSGDFNGDGKADILLQNTDGTPAIWLMNGISLASGATLLNPSTSWHIVGSGDFDGDGKSDILWQNIDGTPAIWLMNGTNLSSGAALPNPSPSWQLKAAADFNGDGKSDLLWQNTDGTPAIWLMNGTSFLSGGLAGFNPGSSWHIVEAGDFNGDGKADILWQNTDGTPAVWLMNGIALVSGGLIPNPGSSWHIVAMAS